MNNCYEEKQKNFQFFWDYIKRTDELKDIFSLKNLHRNLIFNGRTAIKKENMEFNLDIYPLCFKFFSLDDNNKEKESQKLYFPFILMPLFYLLDFTSFKVLLSEIITFIIYRFFFLQELLKLLQTLLLMIFLLLFLLLPLGHLNYYDKS